MKKISKERKLSEYYQFIIQINEKGWIEFLKLNGDKLPSWRQSLSKSQWRKAEKYLNRKLTPFQGYTYTIKNDTLLGKNIKII